MNGGYLIMDARAGYDIDSALVLEHCKTLQEAYHNVGDHGDDSCIVDVETLEVIYQNGKRG